jgi:hypothetical protein
LKTNGGVNFAEKCSALSIGAGRMPLYLYAACCRVAPSVRGFCDCRVTVRSGTRMIQSRSTRGGQGFRRRPSKCPNLRGIARQGEMAVSGGSPNYAPVIRGTPNPPLYYRGETPTQTRTDAQRQVTSMEVWGKPAQGSSIPSVKAYRGALPPRRGIEFCTPVAPTPGRGSPHEARWYNGSAGVAARPNNHVGIVIAYIRNTQVP